MFKTIKMLPCLLILTTVGCSHLEQSKQAPQDEYINRVVLNEIKTSTTSIQQSLTQLNTIELAKYGQPAMPFKKVDAKALQKKLAITWYGPLEPVVKDVAKAVDYKVEIFGKQPVFPVVISLGNLNSPVNDSALNILSNIAVQAKAQATISINQQANIISIRYM